MSLDYPKRADWLKVRSARNERSVAKYVHIAKHLLTVYNEKLRTVETVIAPGRGTTFRRQEAKNPSRRDAVRLGLQSKTYWKNQ